MKRVFFAIFFVMLIQTTIFSLKVCSQEIILKAGIAKTDITPTESLYMGVTGLGVNKYTGARHLQEPGTIQILCFFTTKDSKHTKIIIHLRNLRVLGGELT